MNLRLGLALGLLACCAPLAAREPDGSFRDVLIVRRDESVEVRLPLTDVTGKVRVKEQVPAAPGRAVAPARTALGPAHYLEWQVGYDTPRPVGPTLAEGISFQRRGQRKYGAELSRLLQLALAAGLVTRDDLRRLRAELPALAERSLEKTGALAVEMPVSASEAADGGFVRGRQLAPLLRSERPGGWILLELKPRQRGTGQQAMLYVCLPFAGWRTADGKPRATGPAQRRETVRFVFDRSTHDLLGETVRGFGLASQQHAADLGQILDALLAQQP